MKKLLMILAALMMIGTFAFAGHGDLPSESEQGVETAIERVCDNVEPDGDYC